MTSTIDPRMSIVRRSGFDDRSYDADRERRA